MNNNPALFATIIGKFKPRDFLKDKKGIDKMSDEIFNKELVGVIESAIKSDKVEMMPKAEFRNKEEFAALFDSINGNKGVINTPYGKVYVKIRYAFMHFTQNTYNTNRENIKGGFFSTFRDPLFIAEQIREGSNKPSVYFYKPFYDKDKKLMNIFGIGVDSDGKVDFTTYYHDIKENRTLEMLTSKKIKINYVKNLPQTSTH